MKYLSEVKISFDRSCWFLLFKHSMFALFIGRTNMRIVYNEDEQ